MKTSHHRINHRRGSAVTITAEQAAKLMAYAYGAIGQWMDERVAGLGPDPEHPGYKHFFVQPFSGRQLDWAKAELETPYGRAMSGWKRAGDDLIITALMPQNSTTTLILPRRTTQSPR